MNTADRSLLIIVSSQRRRVKDREGYALLLSILVLSAMLVIGLTVTGIIIVQLRLSNRVFNAMRALAMADSGIEHGLYQDLNPAAGGWVEPGPCPATPPPPPCSIVTNGSYTITKTGGSPNATTLTSLGKYGDAQRSVEVSY